MQSEHSDVRLEDVDSPPIQQFRGLVGGRQPLAGRDGNRCGLGDPRLLVGPLGRHGLFEPQRLVRFEPLGEPDRGGWGQLAMGPDEDVALVADSLPDGVDDVLGVLEVGY